MYRLSFGATDQVAEILATIDLSDDQRIPPQQLYSKMAERAPECEPILRYVPFRLLTPFFTDALRGVPDHEKNQLIRSLADERFSGERPLYRFDGAEAVQLQPDWVAYLASSFPIVEAWAERAWIAYLQTRNPTIPAVSEKIRPPAKRRPLKYQRTYWEAALSFMDDKPKCIYTGAEIDPDTFQLDHFLPWTFVCHDALWNLVPVSPDANSSKGNQLPDPAYLTHMIDLQHRGLSAAKQALTESEWGAATAPFVQELRMEEASLLDKKALAQAYERSIRPQLEIARGVGFEWGWRYTPAI